MSVKYYLFIDGVRRGPFVKDELEGQGLRRDMLVWFKGLPDWIVAGRVPELLDIFEEPPAAPSEAAAAMPRGELPPLPEPDGAVASDQFKDPAVSLPRLASAPATYRDDVDMPPPPSAHGRMAYDVVGIRRLYLAGVIVYVPGLVLALAVGVAIAFLSLYGIEDRQPRFDPQRRDIVVDFVPAARNLQTLAAVCTVGAAVLGVIGLGVGAACFFVLLYRAWVMIQDGRWPTPGRAVGFLFLPLFNIYWTFLAIWGLAWGLQRLIRRCELDAPSPSQPLACALSVYNVVSYIPVAGLVTLGLNVLLLPLFMRSVYRTLSVLCADANRERLAHATAEPSLRRLEPARPVSANILSIAATVVALIGVGLFVGGLCSTLDRLHVRERDSRRLEAHRDAVNHLAGLKLDVHNPNQQQDLNRWRSFHEALTRLEHDVNFRATEDLIISSAALGGGVLLLAIALTLAIVSGLCARGGDDAVPHVPSSWPANHGAGFLPKNARSPARHSGVSRGAALAWAASSIDSA